MRRIVTGLLGLGLAVAAGGGTALAQQAVPIITNADGTNVSASDAGASNSADGSGGTIVYGDITSGPGGIVIGPPPVAPPPAETGGNGGNRRGAGTGETGGTGNGATAVPTATDQDADNLPDSEEPGLGLDPTNPDTDGDGIADGDEINIYGTNPTLFDTDGDGKGDGNEVFWTHTDPLVPDGGSAPQSFQSTTAAPSQETGITATNGDATSVGPGNASAAPGTLTTGDTGGVPTTIMTAGPVTQQSSRIPGSVTTTSNPAPAPPADAVPADTAPAPAAPVDAAPVATCGSYGSWYDAQTAFEAAGGDSGDPALAGSLDPDGNGIVCESMM